MRYGSCRLHIPPELHPVYLGYFDMWDHEPLTSRLFTKALGSGDVVIDVGANIGYFTLLASTIVGPKGFVHAVECAPDTFALLEANVRKNHLQNVKTYPFAAAKERGSLELNTTAIGLSHFVPHGNWPQAQDSRPTISVPAVPLDEIIHSPVDFVKIDAEGADLDVLKGMSRILAENPRISVIVEWAPSMLAEAGQDPLELPRWLQEAGFRNITVLDEHQQKQRSLTECLEIARAGTFPSNWVGDLFARKT